MKSKIGATIFALLVAIVFGAGGVFGIGSLAGQLNGGWQARDWQAVPATVLDTALKESHGDSTTYQVTARYRYVFNGRSYDGTRVGFSSGFDNVGFWQRDHFRRLRAAQHEARPIDVWVDPAAPEHSVIDRNIRWSMVAFSMPFAIVFPLISLGALWMLFRTLWTPAAEMAKPREPDPNALQIRSDARDGARARWAFAMIWGLIAFPLAFLMVPEYFGRSPVWLFVMLFPAVGIALIWSAAAYTLRWTRHGEVVIALNPAQPQVGDSLEVRATFTRAPPAGAYAVSLLCEKVDARGDDTRYQTIWRQERAVQMNGMGAAISFLPPTHLPPSQPHTEIYHRWRVLLSFPGGKDERTFDVVVNPASDAATGALVGN